MMPNVIYISSEKQCTQSHALKVINCAINMIKNVITYTVTFIIFCSATATTMSAAVYVDR